MLTRAWASLLGETTRTHRRAPVIVRKEHAFGTSHDVAIGVHTDTVFGPVITVGVGGACATGAGERLVLLPPLNERLARDLVRGTPRRRSDRGRRRRSRPRSTRWRACSCRCPRWSARCRGCRSLGSTRCASAKAGPKSPGRGSRSIPTQAHGPRATATWRSTRIRSSMVTDVTLRDGTPLHVRPIRPEDAEIERAFVDGLSEQTRYFRFFYQLHELTPGDARALHAGGLRPRDGAGSRSTNRTARRRSSASRATS